LGTRWQIGRTLFELGELALGLNQLTLARQHYAAALDAFEAMSAVLDATRARAALHALPAA
jgi:hypothetical protein